MIDPHNLGTFNSFEEVWDLYPSGGCPGDYVTVVGVVVRWNECQRIWGDSKTFQQNIKYERIDGNVEVTGDLKSSTFEADEANVNTFKTKYIFIENDPYSKIGHNHDDLYSKIGHVHPGLSSDGVANNSTHADKARTLDDDTPVKDWFVRKDIPDIAKEIITFLKGLTSNDLTKLNKGATFGNYMPDLNGSGAKINELGAAEMRSLKLWEFLEVPELRYNRITVNVGDKWNAPGGGIIKEVDTVNKIITLKLEDGEIGAVAVDDICKGIFHSSNLAENATSNTDDSKGNTTFAGFATCYFRVTEILDTAKNSRFSYELRPVSANYQVQYHPSAFMNFVSYANFTNADRQTSNYETRTYTRYLRNMNAWEISQANIAAQFGDLSNLSIHGLNMTGYSAYLNNIYMSGTIQQFELQEPLRMELNSDIGWLIAPGEQMNISANVFKGWVDISSYATSWKWTRDSGDSVEDEAWNNAHSADTTSCSVSFNDLPINSTLFTVTATFLEGTEVVTAYKTFTI